MSSIPLRSPTSASQHRGFQQLHDQDFSYEGGMEGIPLDNVRSNQSYIRGRSDSTEDLTHAQARSTTPEQHLEKSRGLFSHGTRKGGRRKLKTLDTTSRVDSAPRITGLGKFYSKIVGFSPVIRHIVYIIPIGALLAVPIVIGATIAQDAFVGGVRLLWLFTWIETVWLSVWVAKLVAQLLPRLFLFLMGVVSSGTRKYVLIIEALEVPLSLVMWAAVSLITFRVLTSTAPGNKSPAEEWVSIMLNVLAPLLIAAAIYLGEKLIIQLISISYHQRSFDGRIKESKRAVHLIGLLYDASRALFPMYCKEFEDEDILINDSIEALLLSKKAHRRSGSQTPMALIANVGAGVGRFGDKLTSAFGNIASEISGKQVFNPHSAHSIVVEALEKKRSSEALAKRLWMSFVIEGKESLFLDDFLDVLGPSRQEEAEEAFTALDSDGNGDISLDEMIMKVVDVGRDRKAIANSMHDVGSAIAVLDQIFITIVFIIVVFVFVAFQNTNFVTTLATAGTTLLSLSFVFAVTTQEFLGSCIFLFVKHPYDVGDRVTISGDELVVEQISLLYSVFKRVSTMKMVQIPNIILNGLWVENVSRSKAMKEQLLMYISFDTSIEDIELLRKEMENFVRHPDNNRDFQSDIVLECTGIGEMNKMELKVEIKHKSNWSNETVRASRRSKFMCALVLALRKIPIYAPGGGGVALGEPGNPTYSVAVSDAHAAEAREQAAMDKEGKRLVPLKPIKSPNTAAKTSGTDLGFPMATATEAKAADAMNHREAADDGLESFDTTRNSSLERIRSRDLDVEDLRQGLLHRKSTRGRRRPGDRLAPTMKTRMPGLNASVNPSAIREDMDEEAGIEGRPHRYTGIEYSQPSSSSKMSHTMYPPASRVTGPSA